MNIMKTRLAIVTNIPAPYRIPVYELLSNKPSIQLTVIFCSEVEPDRVWHLAKGKFDAIYLKQRFVTFRERFIHINPDVWQNLRKIKPDVIITTGYNPTHLIAYLYTRLYGAKHIAMTDGTLQSEARLSRFHQWLRRWVMSGTCAFIAASNDGFNLFRSYGVTEVTMFKSPLCADNAAYSAIHNDAKKYDLLFVGRFAEGKNPVFTLDVAAEVAVRLARRVSIAFVGSGPLEGTIRARAASLDSCVDTTFLGFAQKDELPFHYAGARVFLFATSGDVWGVVANEACAAGLPVIVSPHAGVAGELVVDGDNGYVRDLDVQAWATAACELLTYQALYIRMSDRSKEKVKAYSYANAANGIADAVSFVTRSAA